MHTQNKFDFSFKFGFNVHSSVNNLECGRNKIAKTELNKDKNYRTCEPCSHYDTWVLNSHYFIIKSHLSST